MSLTIIPKETLAQVSKSLHYLTSLAFENNLPNGLSLALYELATFSESADLDEPLIKELGIDDFDYDTDDMPIAQAIYQLFTLLENMHNKAFDNASHVQNNDKAISLTEVNQFKRLLRLTRPLICTQYLDCGHSDRQKRMLQHFSKLLILIIQNMGSQTGFEKRLSETLYNIAAESAIAAFEIGEHTISDLSLTTLADDLMAICRNGDSLLGEENALRSALSGLKSFCTEGVERIPHVVDGKTLILSAYHQLGNPQWKLPLGGKHSKSAIKPLDIHNLMSYPIRLQADYRIPTLSSLHNILYAITKIRLALQKLPTIIGIDDLEISPEEREDFLLRLIKAQRDIGIKSLISAKPYVTGDTYKQETFQGSHVTL